MSIRLASIAALGVLALTACDNRELVHEPDPTLARMLQQRRGDIWETTGAFANRMVMRDPPKDTVARGDDTDDPPPPVTHELLDAGRARFEIVCATCHGVLGDGKSVVATKMEFRPPPSLHEPRVMALSHDQIFAVITEGYGLMPSYAAMLTRHDRWAVIAYLDALRLSQAARVSALPKDMQDALAKEGP